MAESDERNKETAKKATKPRAPRAKKPAEAKAAQPVRVTFASEAATETPREPAKGRVTPEERQRLVSERAYAKALRRKFKAGNPRADWLEAEAEIDAELLEAEGTPRRKG